MVRVDDGTSRALAEPPAAGRYAVLGASGLVGSHVLAALAGRDGVTVSAIGFGRLPERVADNVTVDRVDLRDADAAERCVARHDYVVLCAGRVLSAPVLAADAVGPVLDHLRIVATALAACWRARVRKVVWLSSTTGYPESGDSLAEAQMFDGEPPKVWSLVGGATRYLETLARDLSRTPPAATTFIALRPSLIYGENDDFSPARAHFVPALIRRVVERQSPIEVWGDGSERRDLVHAADVAAVALRALQVVAGWDAFNVCAGSSDSIEEVLARILAIDGFDDVEIAYRTDRPRSVRERRLSGRKAAEVLGFTPRIDLESGLRRTIAWFREKGARRAAGAASGAALAVD